MMFWKSAYEKFLEAEVDRLRASESLLLSVLLERAGHKEAAMMARGPQVAPTTTELLQRGKQKYDESKAPARGWRGMAEAASRATMPKEPKDSTEALEQRIAQEIPR